MILSTPPNYLCVWLIKTSRFLFLLHCIPCTGLTSFSLYPLRCLSNSTGKCFTFSHNIPSTCKDCCDHFKICFFISFSSVKMSLQMTHAFNYLSVSSEVFLFRVLNIKKWFVLVHVISWNKKMLSHRWTWKNISWGCFHCEITRNKIHPQILVHLISC